MSSVVSPLSMLAISMQAQPGVYAVLLGSGVSTASGIPTGWGVVCDLVRRCAAAQFPDNSAELDAATRDPEKWWLEHFGETLGYSSLLESLAPTPATRQGLLAEFFEPTDEDRDAGLKVPGQAHLAIAGLVKSGHVRVVLTTNFDRLMEQALEAVGISPQVIGRPEAVNGMAPLAHAPATIIKLHGDYKDLGSRNTVQELETYPPEWQLLVRQVLDEYGLVISGWSAEWDIALVALMEESPNRRYPMYWDSRSSKGEAAGRLLSSRRGTIITAAGADELFRDLGDSLEALERLAEPPLTTAMALAKMKKYLPDPVRRIDLHDLVMSITQVVEDHVRSQPVVVEELTFEKVDDLLQRHLAATTPLMQVLIPAVNFDHDGLHDRLWVEVLQRLITVGTISLSQVTVNLDTLRLYPALLVQTAMGIESVRRGRETLIIRMGMEASGSIRGESLPAAQLLHPARVLSGQWVNELPRWKGGQWIFPQSHLLRHDLRQVFLDEVPQDSNFSAAFDGLEYRLGLLHEATGENVRAYRAMDGEYVGETSWSWGNESTPTAEIEFRKVGDLRSDWPWPAFLCGEGDDFDDHLLHHRELLENHKRRSW